MRDQGLEGAGSTRPQFTANREEELAISKSRIQAAEKSAWLRFNPNLGEEPLVSRTKDKVGLLELQDAPATKLERAVIQTITHRISLDLNLPRSCNMPNGIFSTDVRSASGTAA